MSSAWLLPEHIADVLPREARRIEELRRGLLDVAGGYGCELVMPPLLEHLESLLSGTGRELDLKTFKLVDQLSAPIACMRRASSCSSAPRSTAMPASKPTSRCWSSRSIAWRTLACRTSPWTSATRASCAVCSTA
jgi:Histidyl-tRNA synthetase